MHLWKCCQEKKRLLHISEISNKRIEKTEDALKEGQIVRVKVISMENEDKFNLSMKRIVVINFK